MRSITWLALALLMVAALASAARLWRTANQPRALVTGPTVQVRSPRDAIAEDYVGASQCALCHSQIYELQSRSHMAGALHTVEEFQRVKRRLPEGRVYDGAHDIQYEVSRDGDGLSLKVSLGSESTELPIVYALGSGASGVSFLHELPDSVLELRVSYYTDSGDWDLTPGQAELPVSATAGNARQRLDAAVGLRFAKDSSNNCLKCHSTLLVEVDGRVDPSRSHFGVSCERCHGPGRAHIEAALRGQNLPPRNWQVEADLTRFQLQSPDPAVQATGREMRLCGECHGGDKSHEDDLRLSRFHVAAMMKSKCYAQLPVMLRCTDCHDPHQSALRGDPTPYIQVCRACHRDAADDAPDEPASLLRPGLARLKNASFPRPVCPVNARDDCLRCHMPQRHPLYRSTFTLHRIAIHPADAEIYGPEHKKLPDRRRKSSPE